MAEGSETKKKSSFDALREVAKDEMPWQGLDGTTVDLESMVAEAEKRLRDFDLNMNGRSYERVVARGDFLENRLQEIAAKIEAAAEYFNNEGSHPIDDAMVGRWEDMRERVTQTYQRLGELQREVAEEQKVEAKLADIDEKLANLVSIVADLSSGALMLDAPHDFPEARANIGERLDALRADFKKGRDKHGDDERFTASFALLDERFQNARRQFLAFGEALDLWLDAHREPDDKANRNGRKRGNGSR